MTCDQRIENLLNRAGQTIIDIKPTQDEMTAMLNMSFAEVAFEYLMMVHIIDRLEWALDKTLNELDHIRETTGTWDTSVPENWRADDDESPVAE